MRLVITFWGDKCYREGYPECKCGCREYGCFTRVLSVHFIEKVGCKDKYKENVKNIYKNVFRTYFQSKGILQYPQGRISACSRGIRDLGLMSNHWEWISALRGGSQLCSREIQDLGLMSSHWEWMRGAAGLVGLKQTRGWLVWWGSFKQTEYCGYFARALQLCRWEWN